MGMSDAAEFLKTLEVESKPYFIRAWRGIRKREVDVVGMTKMLEIVKEEAKEGANEINIVSRPT
jgi:hypothetical protein